MKALECYQPRGIAKLLFYLFLLWTAICCMSVISNNDYFIEGIVCSILFDMTIFLIIFGILVYKITATDECIIVRKWYGRHIKIKLDDITKVIMPSHTGKAINACRVHIYKNKKKIVSLDPLMENYDEMVKYIIKHIDETK
ncbi:hypothetical protein [Eubacterium ventriosum]|uniref:hypothetical protein n=1 Tax=Eubacterium ventriosum TaxID=39496 RepID=UPI001C0288C0|nr:hypothetical protein [Eubacterium ventriosum]